MSGPIRRWVLRYELMLPAEATEEQVLEWARFRLSAELDDFETTETAKLLRGLPHDYGESVSVLVRP